MILQEWFMNIDGNPFVSFGTSHLIMILIYVIGIIFFFFTRKHIVANQFIYNLIRWSLFSILVLSEISYQIWTATNGIWSLSEYIPLHLCGIASIIGAIALASLNRKLIIISFFIGFIPAFLAIITPELLYEFPHFRFLQFFVSHLAISWTGIFLLTTRSIKVTFKSMLETYAYVLIYSGIIGFVVNPLLGSNYLYLASPPAASTPLDLLGSGVWYYVNLCLLAYVVFFGLWLVVKLIDIRNGEVS
ncbi:TIGR02206 family membrane protein [Oceanobacillus chungangensis]|uniref:TIGR02206 family membrane protein n=1 Tax=Oceanobacillus chungangensis TaxID=1229152 RepID=A0A3D8PIH2_9BACI|nr:TIGR02206 family membrane protein [Oceanobacillus chungangensis]RDW14975.1 TIGR02206 family membrane protein [Oceanobacillus chungangensis]